MHAREIEGCAARLRLRLWLAHAVHWWLGGVMMTSAGWAASVLVLRLGGRGAPVWAWVALCAGMALVGLAAGWGRRPGREACMAAIERASQGGGIVLAYADGGGGSAGWLARAGAARGPRVRWRVGRRVAGAVAAVLCVPAAYVVPLPGRAAAPASSAHANELIAKMEAEARVLEQAYGGATGLAQLVRQQLAELAQTGTGGVQRHTWEALDHVREQLDAAAQAGARAAVRAAEEWHALDYALQRMERAAQAGEPAGSAAQQQAREQLRAAAAQSMWSNELAGAGSALAGGGQLSAGQLAALRGQLNLFSNNVLRMAGNFSTNLLLRGGLTNLADVVQGRCSGGGEKGAARELERFLAKEPRGFERTGSAAGARACALAAVRGAQWSVSRGRGDAPLTFEEPSNEEGVARQLMALPEAQQRSLNDVVSLGESGHAPHETGTGEPVQGGALAAAQAGAGGAQEAGLLPRHRACVEEYFKE